MRKFKVVNNTPPSINSEDIKVVQDYNNKQPFSKGFAFSTQIGSGNIFNPELGGSIRRLHGILFIWPAANINDDDIISLKINNETVIDKVNWKAYSPASTGNPFKPNQFYELRRALGGSDVLELTVNAVAAHLFYPIFFISNA
jgi:hypothetical protein